MSVVLEQSQSCRTTGTNRYDGVSIAAAATGEPETSAGKGNKRGKALLRTATDPILRVSDVCDSALEPRTCGDRPTIEVASCLSGCRTSLGEWMALAAAGRFRSTP